MYLMGKINQHTRGHTLFVNISGWKEVIKMAPYLRNFDASDVAKQRLKIIKFYEVYGEKACIQAFGVDRKLICVWRKRIRDRNGHISALVPDSTIPLNTRKRYTNPRVVKEIKRLRKKYCRLGKIKIKPLLDEYCYKENLPTCSTAKIGRIIKDKKLFYQSSRVYHNPNHKRRKKKKRLRVRYAPKPTELGHIQMDTVVRIEDGVRHYILSAIDIRGKFALSLPVKSPRPKYTLEFFEKLKYVLPYDIKSVLTDNGSEFLGVFEEYLAKNCIKHYFIYPRCPRVNGVVERYQRSLQEEFVDPNVYLVHNQEVFSKALAQYLIFYNTKRVHQSLDYETPVDYMLAKGEVSNMYRARTTYCQNYGLIL